MRLHSCTLHPKKGPLAQSVEQRTFNPWVVGSIPTGPTPWLENRGKREENMEKATLRRAKPCSSSPSSIQLFRTIHSTQFVSTSVSSQRDETFFDSRLFENW